MSLLNIAFSYAERGWKVFPIIPGGKLPLKDSHGFEDATTSRHIIREWWKANPNYNIGIATGHVSDLVVFDFDIKNDQPVRDAYKQLMKEHHLNTLMSRTPSGGIHLLFQYAGDDIGNRAGVIPGLDIRGTGGYIVAPGSSTADGEYKWEDDSVLPEPLPDGLKGFLKLEKTVSQSIPFDRASVLDGVPEGQRDDKLYKYVCSLQAKGSTRAEAEVLVRVAADNCKPPFDISAALEKVVRVYDKYGDNREEPVGDVWEDPVPLEAFTLPRWPEGVFPEVIDKFVVSVSAFVENPIEVVFMDTLTACACAVQGKYQVMVKPGYYEPLNIWGMPISPPATRKTTTKQITMAPLVEWEDKKFQDMEKEIKENNSERKTLLKRIEYKRNQAAKSKDINEAKELDKEVIDLEGEVPEELHAPRLWTEDVTPESLGMLMAQNQQRMAIMSAEGGIFGIMAGRYSQGAPNIDIFLKAHAGEPVRVDRGTRDPVYMNAPCLTVGLSVQPEVVMGVSTNREFRGRGLVARFLYVYPRNRLGSRRGDNKPISGGVKLGYHGMIKALLDKEPLTDQFGKEVPRTIELSEDAGKAWQAFWLEIEAMLADGGMLDHIRDWGGKLPGAVARIAGIFHCLRRATIQVEAQPVSLEDMENAIRVGQALIQHALKVFDTMKLDPAHDGARVILSWIRSGARHEFRARDCHRSHNSRFKRADEMYAALKVLQEAGWIEPKPHTNNGPGQPPKDFKVNDAAF